MTSYDAGNTSVNKEIVPIQVTSWGEWTANYGGQTHRADTKKGLEEALKAVAAKRRVKVSVPAVKIKKTYTRADGVVLTRITGVLTGLHAGTGNVLAVWQDGEKTEREQINASYRPDEYTVYAKEGVTTEDVAEYQQLLRTLEAAREAVSEWERVNKIRSVKDAVVEAIDAKQAQA